MSPKDFQRVADDFASLANDHAALAASQPNVTGSQPYTMDKSSHRRVKRVIENLLDSTRSLKRADPIEPATDTAPATTA